MQAAATAELPIKNLVNVAPISSMSSPLPLQPPVAIRTTTTGFPSPSVPCSTLAASAPTYMRATRSTN